MDPGRRPRLGREQAGGPRDVAFQLQLIALPSIDTVNNRFRFRAFARFHWRSPELDAADAGLYVDDDAMRRLSQMWWPIPEVVNQVGQVEIAPLY